MTSLADLPGHRRDSLLLRYEGQYDYYEVDDLVRERSRRPCRWDAGPPPITGELLAVPGSDGRYHLCVDGTLKCTGLIRPVHQEGGHLHRQLCSWVSDGTTYRAQPPRGAPMDAWPYGSRSASWVVTLHGDGTDPALVRTRHRCPDSLARGQWPPYQDPHTPLGQVRAVLISAFGRDCHACRRRVAVDVDHDPITGLVRGMLCKTCNNHVETCTHVAGCPWADYLSNPPAAPLQLTYPRLSSARRDYQRRIASLGFDPYAEAGSSGSPRDLRTVPVRGSSRAATSRHGPDRG